MFVEVKDKFGKEYCVNTNYISLMDHENRAVYVEGKRSILDEKSYDNLLRVIKWDKSKNQENAEFFSECLERYNNGDKEIFDRLCR